MKRLGWCVLALWAGAASATGQPLTLEAVLATADAPHPDLDLARARQDVALADVRAAESLNDFRVTLEASLRSGRNEIYDDHYQPDHFARVVLRKTLWDDGRQQVGRRAVGQESEALGLRLLDIRAQRRLSLMARYFDVLLADMRDAADTEFLAVAYVAWDNAKDRQALGQMAGWELSELENRYLDARTLRNDGRRKLREKRMLLAAAMNRAGMVQEDLVDPRLPGNDRPLPEFETLLAGVLERNPGLLAQRQLLAAATSRLDVARADYRPSLEFEAEAATWDRPSTTRDDLRAGFNLVWPIWQGGRADARIGKEQARFHELQAQHDKLVADLRQAVLEAREEIQHLRESERRRVEVNAAYRDIALEKARAEYELELKANLGNSMAETQVARLRQRAIEYRLALAWARLEALLGDPGELTRLADAMKTEDRK
ncbi:MAG: TolC family protein [Thiobacillaceae bacterium]|jgi:outer membrane protein TolC|nr:TolC family protein [Thiobacillaceae bacterium]